MPNSLKRRINPADRYPQQFQHPMMLPERPMENQQFAEPPMKQMKGRNLVRFLLFYIKTN